MSVSSTEGHLQRLMLTVCDYWTALRSHCKHAYCMFDAFRGTGESPDALVEVQVKAQLREQVCSAIVERSTPRTHSHPHVELLATIISWAIYGAALEGSQRTGDQVLFSERDSLNLRPRLAMVRSCSNDMIGT